jgi:uncharacterized protein YcbK (DUF882 family)
MSSRKLVEELGFGLVVCVSMRIETFDAGHRPNLKTRFVKAVASMALAGALASAAFLGTAGPLGAAGETRTISFYHIHTKEKLTVTYMVDGRYVPSAMKQINYHMRDWRKNTVVNIDPKTIDLVWELHSDLGSKAPIHIVCGLRTSKTNAFLKRSGRKVARHSQHTLGKAIDFFFPDVSTLKIRNSALVRRIGGVGYYRNSTGPTGFLHVDTGRVRHWGPPISRKAWASINAEGRKTVGKRLTRNDQIVVANVGTEKVKSGGIFGRLFGRKNKDAAQPAQETPVAVEDELPPVPNYEGFNEEMAELAEESATLPKKAGQKAESVYDLPADKEKPAAPAVVAAKKVIAPEKQALDKKQLAALTETAATEEVANAKLDSRKLEKRIAAIEAPRTAEEPVIEPAAANPDEMVQKKPSAVKNNVEQAAIAKPKAAKKAVVEDAAEEDLANIPSGDGVTGGKADFASELRIGESNDAPVIRSALTTDGSDSEKGEFLATADQLTRLNGAPQSMDEVTESVLPGAGIASEEGKGDLFLVNRDGKGNLEELPDVSEDMIKIVQN